MKLSTVIERMPYWYKSRKSMYFTSPPGRGKTTVIERVPEIIGKKLGLNLGVVVINGGLLTPMDAIGFGLPKHFEDHSEMVFSDPFFYRTDDGQHLKEYDGGVIFIDEADKMDTDCKKALGDLKQQTFDVSSSLNSGHLRTPRTPMRPTAATGHAAGAGCEFLRT